MFPKTAPLALLTSVLLGLSACSGDRADTGGSPRPSDPAAPSQPPAETPPAEPAAPAAPAPAAPAPAAPRPAAPAAAAGERRTLEGGIEVEVVAQGSGEPVRKGAVAVVHYIGTFEDGRKFDSSRDRGQPFPVIAGEGLVIPGWDRTLTAMRVGDRWKVKIPSELAYGERGMGGAIPANTDLYFDVEVLALHDVSLDVQKRGTGPEIDAGDFATVHYTGTLQDGTKFDSSRDRNQPFPVPVGAGRVIPGWEAALLRMREGDRANVTIPWQLAYGEQGSPPDIPPRANLVFDIEVLKVQKRQ